jgi:hypothetical protein
MPQYTINKNAQNDGYHEIHNVNTCSYLPQLQNRIDLGLFDNCSSAVLSAKLKYPNNKVDGCYYCCNTCHTR